MILEEINIGDKYESKRKAILDNLGKEVILRDLHESLGHVILLKEKDSETYRVHFNDHRCKTRDYLHYHDLQMLIVIHNFPKYESAKP